MPTREVNAKGTKREERRRRQLQRALDVARAKLTATRPQDYAQDRYYRAVRTTRERKIRQLEGLLREEG